MRKLRRNTREIGQRNITKQSSDLCVGLILKENIMGEVVDFKRREPAKQEISDEALDVRMAKIRKSVARINALMQELRGIQAEEDKQEGLHLID